MRVHRTTWIINLILICLFESIVSYPRINTSKQRDINAINTQRVEELFVDSDLCESSVCQSKGKSLKANLNPSVDPCDDFYEFACGGWLSSTKLPPGKNMLLGEEVYGLNTKITKIINDSLQMTRSESDSKAIVFAAQLYKTCVDNSTRESLGVTPLKSALNVLGGWPIAGSFNEKQFDWKESFSTVIAQFGSNPVFSVGVDPDSNNTKANILTFGVAQLGLYSNQLLDQTKYPEVSAYKKFILQTAVLLGAKNESQTHQQIEEILAFETKLANSSSKRSHNRTTFKDFNQLTDNRVDWFDLVNKVYAKLNSTVRVRSDDTILVYNTEYYKAVTKLMEETPKRVIANYFGWSVAKSLSRLANQELRNANFQFNKLITHAKNDTLLHKECYNLVAYDTFEYVASRLYVEKSFTKRDKEVATVMVNDIKESFTELLEKSDWLDNSTRAEALHKVKAVRPKVGYPDWILDNKQLDNFYNLTIKVDPKKFFENMLYLKQKSTFRSYNALRETVNLDTSWSMPSHVINAGYGGSQNSITLPAAILDPFYFDSRLPAHLNYGSIGSIVGHELTHGFDEEGSKNDANGNERNWWTEEMAQKFRNKTECFRKEYNSYVDSQSKMNLNGNLTIDEDIADNGGIREAYNAYLKYVEKHGKQQRLPDISQYSVEQQFFISYANIWCTKFDDQFMKEFIQFSFHSAAKYRVNLPLTNFQTFSDVYKCSANSRMNRKEKCVLW